MKITIAKDAGYCFGVRDAVDLAYDISNQEGTVYMLGDIVHNEKVVDDLEKSIEFYRDVLGFKHIRTQDMGFQKIAFISTGDGEPQIELKEVTAPFRGMPTEGFSHVGIFVQNVDAIYEKSIEYGAEWRMKPTVLGPGAPYFGSMRDPDGYEIEVMENPTGGCVSCHRGPHLN